MICAIMVAIIIYFVHKKSHYTDNHTIHLIRTQFIHALQHLELQYTKRLKWKAYEICGAWGFSLRDNVSGAEVPLNKLATQ